MKTKIMTIKKAESKVNFDIIDHMDQEAMKHINDEIEITWQDDDTVDFKTLPMRDRICTESIEDCSEIFE